MEEFFQEAEDTIEEMEQSIGKLEDFSFKGDPSSQTQVDAFYHEKNVGVFAEILKQINRNLHSLKGVSAIVGLKQFSDFCHLLEDVTGGIYLGNLIFTDPLRDHLGEIPGMMTHFLQRIAEDHSDGDVAIHVEQDKIITWLEEAKSRQKASQINIKQMSQQDFGEVREVQRQAKISLDLDTFDQIVQDFQSFTQRMNQILKNTDLALDLKNEVRNHLTHHMNDLITASQSKMVLKRYNRLVSDLSRSLGKDVEFKVNRNEALARPDVWDKVHLALVHMVRNSVDHGIEFGAIRKRFGKPEMGTIELDIYEDHRNTYIVLEDDGAGVDPEKIADMVIEKGIRSRSELDQMSQAEIQQLIFLPGFSTKGLATQVSGRGVGLDAALEEIRNKLSGQIHFHSEPGKGTRFQLEIPMQEILSECILFGDDRYTYAVPLFSKVSYLDCLPQYIRNIPHRSPIYTEGEATFPLLVMMHEMHPELFPNLAERGTTIIQTTDKDGNQMGLAVPKVFGHQLLKIHRNQKISHIIRDQGMVFGFSLTDPVIPVLDPEFLKKRIR